MLFEVRDVDSMPIDAMRGSGIANWYPANQISINLVRAQVMDVVQGIELGQDDLLLRVWRRAPQRG